MRTVPSLAAGLSLAILSAAPAVWAQAPAPFLTVGPEVPLWVSLAVADWGVKLALAAIALIPFRLILGRLRPFPAS